MADLDNENPLDRDFVWGARAIARALNCDVRRVFYLLENGRLPARKIGGLWVASRSQLRAALLDQSAEEPAPPAPRLPTIRASASTT